LSIQVFCLALAFSAYPDLAAVRQLDVTSQLGTPSVTATSNVKDKGKTGMSIAVSCACLFAAGRTLSRYLRVSVAILKLDQRPMPGRNMNLHYYFEKRLGGFAMRFATKVMAALVVVPAVLSQTPASSLPCDNTRWCAEYAPNAGGTNCGFFTIE